MKIAIISDIHGNIEALNSVLEHIEYNNCKKIFCLGDIAMAGPCPTETINKIQQLIKEEKLLSIQGNTDEMISCYNEAQVDELKKANPVMGNALENDKTIITTDLKEFLKDLPKTKELEIGGVKVFLAHGSPRRNNENIFPDLPIAQVEEMIKQTNADVIFVGHTHIPCGYQTNTNQTVVNVGSVGRPFTKNPDSCYAILQTNKDKTFTIEHHFVKYDKEKASNQLKERKFDGAEKLAQMLIQPTERYPR